MVHGSDAGEGDDCVEWASNYLEAYRAAQLPKITGGPTMPIEWKAPTDTIIKVNVDVGFIDPKHYQVAAVGRNKEGECMGWRVRQLVGQPPAVVGEARAALEGMTLATEMGWEEIVLGVDCAQIAAAIQNRVDDSCLSFGALMSHCLQLSSSFRFFSSSFVKRLGNKLAHALAHLNLDNSDVSDDVVLPADLALVI